MKKIPLFNTISKLYVRNFCSSLLNEKGTGKEEHQEPVGTVRVTSLAVCLRGSLPCLCKHLTRKNISTDIMTEPSGHSQSASRPHGPSTPTPLNPWLCPQPDGRPSPLGASVSPPVKREGEEGALNYLCISSSLTFLSVILLATLSPV